MTKRKHPTEQGINRRNFLGKAATVGAAVSVPWTFPSQASARQTLVSQASFSRVRQQPLIRPRSDWDQGNGPTGPIEAEDPRFLLVHHTAQPGNDYSVEDVPALIRSMYWFHSGPDKGWPDVAYNFFVDQFGTTWEGRTGSMAGPVQGSATGGNQGFSQLCCFIGNLSEQDPTPAATDSMVELLAWLASQYSIDISQGSTTTFVSRGSNKWPQGTEVTTPTIAGHRDMSQTSCPGDKGYAFVTSRLPVLVLAKINGVEPPPGPDPDLTSTTEPETTEPATTETSAVEAAGSASTETIETSTTALSETTSIGSATSVPTPSTSSGLAEVGSELDQDFSALQPVSDANGSTRNLLRWTVPATLIAAAGGTAFHHHTKTSVSDGDNTDSPETAD